MPGRRESRIRPGLLSELTETLLFCVPSDLQLPADSSNYNTVSLTTLYEISSTLRKRPITYLWKFLGNTRSPFNTMEVSSGVSGDGSWCAPEEDRARCVLQVNTTGGNQPLLCHDSGEAAQNLC